MIRRTPGLVVLDRIDPSFDALRAEERELFEEIRVLPLEVLRGHRLLSGNAKTSFSFDLPIGHTCRPTPVCSFVCYGKRRGAPARWTDCLLMRLRNLRYVQLAPTDEVVERLEDEHARLALIWSRKAPNLKFNFLRFCGTGDLVPELVQVINRFTRLNPQIRAWVVTRRFDLAAHLEPNPSLYLQLSLDMSTAPEQIEEARQIVRANPRAYLSFLRTAPDQDTLGARIVFNEKHTRGLPYDRTTDCPVDAGRLDLDNERGAGGAACAKCRRCFSRASLAPPESSYERAA